ncbi:MAG: response regulator [Pseudomonadota bacterium]
MVGQPASSSPNNFASLRISIVEDNAIIALDLSGQMEDLQHEIVGIATTADKAISIAEAMQPDLAIVDLQLADGSRGQDAAIYLRTELGIPSILLSGSLHLLTDDEHLSIEPLAMLPKPMQPHELENAIRSYAKSP